MSEPTVRFSGTPVDAPISGTFGEWYGTYQHRGVDFACVTGTPVYAPADGEVVDFLNSWTTWQGQPVRSFGIGVCIRMADGWYSLLAHLSQAIVNIGDRVEAGQLIGYSGNTGVSTGPHLHWQHSDTPSFPVDISHSRDPMKNIEKEEPLTKNERTLTAVAWGDYDRMCSSYNALVDAGLIPDEDLKNVDDLNSAVVKRGRVMELVATNPDKACEVIK